METGFELVGGATMALQGDSEAVARYVRAELDPYGETALDEGERDVVISPYEGGEPVRLVDVQNPAGDGVVTASDGEHLYAVVAGRWCRVPASPGERPLGLTYEHGFPLRGIFRTVVRPTLQVALLDRGAATLHSASVAVDGNAVAIAGWSESGKTETALALVEQGAVFLSDKWTIVTADGTAGVFPISVGIRGWVLRYLPRLRASLPAGPRIQLGAAAAASALSAPLRGVAPGGRLGALVAEAARLVALPGRAAVRPTAVRRMYGQPLDSSWSAPLKSIVVLTTVSDDAIAATEAEPEWAVRRLARSAAFERRPFFALWERRRYAFPDEEASPAAEVERRDERLLERIVESTRVISVTAPFPCDPRRVADAISRYV